ALHRLEAREQVLVGAGDHVMDARLAVGRGRALVEDPFALRCRPVHRPPEDALAFPELDDLALQRGEVDLLAYLSEPHSLPPGACGAALPITWPGPQRRTPQRCGPALGRPSASAVPPT